MKSIAILAVTIQLFHPFAWADEPKTIAPLAQEKLLSNLIQDLKSADRNTRIRAAEAIARLGPAAKEAVSALLDAAKIQDGRFPDYVYVAIWKVDPDAYGDLLKGKGTPGEQGSALMALRYVGKDAKRFADVVLKTAVSGDPRHRAVAVWCLADIGVDAKGTLPILIPSVRRIEGNSEQMNAAQCLAKYGPSAKDALPALRIAAKHYDAKVRVEAARAIWKVEDSAEHALPILIEACNLDFTSGQTRAAQDRAVKTLADMGPAAKDAFPTLLKLWKATAGDDRNLKRLHDEATKALKAIDAKAADEAGAK